MGHDGNELLFPNGELPPEIVWPDLSELGKGLRPEDFGIDLNFDRCNLCDLEERCSKKPSFKCDEELEANYKTQSFYDFYL